MKYSFQKGYQQVPLRYESEVKDRIMSALNIKTRSAWGERLKGNVEPKISEAMKLEEIFYAYGITDIWGEED